MKIPTPDRKSTRLNSSHANICPLSLHDALAICQRLFHSRAGNQTGRKGGSAVLPLVHITQRHENTHTRSEEHTSELQSRQYLPSFPTRRSCDLSASFPFPSRQSDRSQRRLCRATPRPHNAAA